MEKDQRTDNQGNCRDKQSDRKRDPRPSRSTNWTNANARRVFPSSPLEFLRDLGIAKIILVKVKQMQAQPMLHLALA